MTTSRPAFVVVACVFLGLAMSAAASAQTPSADESARALLAKGDAYAAEAVRRPDLALQSYRAADTLLSNSADLRLRADARSRMARMLFESDQLAACISTGREAAELARRAKAPDIEGDALRIIGGAAIQLGRFDQADADLNAAVTILQSNGTSDQLARAYSNLAASARIQGFLGEAIRYGRQALAVVDRALANNETLTPRVLFAAPFNLGKAMADSGDYSDSRVYLERAFTTAERLNDIGGQMHVLFDTGEWYEVQGDAARASRYYRRAVEYAHAHVAGAEAEAKARQGLGRLALAAGRYPEAVEQFTEATRLFADNHLDQFLVPVLVDLARARAAAGDGGGAEHDLERAITVARQRSQQAPLVRGLIERGRIRLAEGRVNEARQDFAEALGAAERSRLIPFVPAALAGRGSAAEASHDLPAAIDAYEQAANALDRIRGRIVSPDLRATFAAATHDTYSGLVRVLLELHAEQPTAGYGERALATLERERSQALALELNEARLAVAVRSNTPDVEGRIAQIQTSLFVPDLSESRRKTLLQDLDDAERDLSMAPAVPGAASTAAPLTVNITAFRSALQPDEIAIQYSIAAPSTAFVISKSGIKTVPLALPADLDGRVAFFVRALESNASDAATGAGQALSARLIDPLLPMIPSGARLLIAASGALARLPFGALPLRNDTNKHEPLLRRNDVSYLPSLSLFAAHRNGHGATLDRRMLAVADAVMPQGLTPTLAPLPGSRTEAASVAGRGTTSQLLVGPEATEHAVKAMTGQYSVVHLATHAVLDAQVPERSAVLLGASNDEDGLLQAREIYRLSLRRSLVVLSGCSTADGEVSGAEGLRSLARAFVQAGGQAVIGSLWNLPDASTAMAIDRFYTALDRGAAAGSALQAAQLAIAGTDPYANSRAWAALVIVGDPKLTLDSRQQFPWIALVPLMLIGIIAAGWRWRPRVHAGSERAGSRN